MESSVTDGELVALVNPLQGTNSHYGFSIGNTLPLTAMPFGMTHWAPQTAGARNGWYFHPGDRWFEGVRATHQPSPWINDYGFFVVMPQTGLLKPNADGRRSAYQPETSEFHPHYFRANMIRYDCDIELTPTERCALMRCHFRADEKTDPVGATQTRRIIIEPGRDVSAVEVLADQQTVRGWTRGNSGGVPAGYALYFVVKFNAPITGYGVFKDREIRSSEAQGEGERMGAYVEFGTGELTVEAKIATSFIGWEQAEQNIASEIGSATFEELRARAASAWESIMGRLKVEGGSDDQRRTFYSCLYRTQLFPRDFHEYDTEGKPRHFSPYDGRVHDGVLVTDNGFWDTYRTVYPLYSLLCPDRLSTILEGWLNAYRESDWFPTWASPGHRLCMVGTHADAVFADAVTKGIGGFDLATAYEGLRKHSFEIVEADTGFGRLGQGEYLELGYVPDDRIHHASASRTLDYAYDDFCIAQVAKVLGKDEDVAQLTKQAGYWRNVYDASVGMMRGRNSDGSWRTPWDEYEWGGPFVEGGTWQHTWAVPHDTAGLIAIMGGPEAFAEKLERMLTQVPRFRVGTYGNEIHEMTEMACAGFGQYAQSNQPVHQALYQFACAGRPDRTQYWVRRVLSELYSPDKFPGDEDNGEMSAWYVLSAIGLYPLCPGHPSYVLGSPLFPAAHLALAEGKTLTVRAETEDGKPIEDCPYVRSVTWNGQPWSKLWIGHAELMAGGELLFQLSDTPDLSRTFSSEELPFSQSPYAAQ